MSDGSDKVSYLTLLRDWTERPLSIFKPTASLAVDMHDFPYSLFCERSCSHVPGPNSSLLRPLPSSKLVISQAFHGEGYLTISFPEAR